MFTGVIGSGGLISIKSAVRMHSFIRPYQHVAFRLPSDMTKIVQLIPNTYAILWFFVRIVA